MSTKHRHVSAPFVPMLAAVALCAPAAHAQQTLSLTLNAAAAHSAPYVSTYGSAYADLTAANSGVLTLTAGTPQTVTLGTLDMVVSSFDDHVRGPSYYNFPFDRAIMVTATLDSVSSAFLFVEPLSASGNTYYAGSVGQYFQRSFFLDSVTEDYGLGSVGILHAQFQSFSAFDEGPGTFPPPPVTAILTFIPAPEPSQLVGLALGVLSLGIVSLKARKRRTVS